jgi:hypothetical protein
VDVVAGQLQQVGADRVQAVVAGQVAVGVQGVQHLQARPRALDHRERHGMAQRDHRVRPDPFEQLVQDEDLRPVGRGRGGASSWTAAIAAWSR